MKCAHWTIVLLAAGWIWQSGNVDAAPKDEKKAAIPLDLSGAVLTQTNCKTSTGCGHPHVTVGASSVMSDGTAASPAQHILSLRLSDASQLQHAGHRPRSLDVDYELRNPSGHKNNLLCASALINGRLVQRCANPYTTSGRLSVPLHAAPTDIALQFGLMPWSAGHRFAVKNVQLSFGKQHDHTATPKREVDFTAGRLQQRGCATPVGCVHKAVTLTSNAFRSSVGGEIVPPPPPNDNPNLPPPTDNPAPDRRLSLEIPVPAHGKSLRTLSFSYMLQTATQGGSQIVVTARGRTIVESVIDAPGSGVVSMELPHSSLPIDSVTFAFVPRGGAPSVFGVSDAGLGPRPVVGARPLPASEDDEGGGLSRLDPCGPHLHTFWVTGADSREGRGIRCVSPDLRSWYGEGWWIDPAYGYYRHLGYIPDETFNLAPGFALALDFGVVVLGAVGDDGRRIAYGTDGGQILHIDRLAADRWHVSTASRSWNEYWQLVPKTELLPEFFGNVPWERECGTFGLHAFEAVSSELGFLKRCAMPADLTADPNDLRRASLPLVWYGESYLYDPRGDHDEEPERTHLGWLRRFAEPPSPLGLYRASDRCLALPRIAFCTSFDEITAEVIGHGASDYPAGAPQDFWENDWFDDTQGLFMVGPGVWGEHDGDGHAWTRLRSLPPDASLPLPTPICLDDDCPS